MITKYYVLCRNCKNRIYLTLKKKYYKRKKDLIPEIGNEFSLCCPHCYYMDFYLIEDIVAEACYEKNLCSIPRAIANMFIGLTIGMLVSLPLAYILDNGLVVWFFSILGITLGLIITLKKDEEEINYILEFNYH